MECNTGGSGVDFGFEERALNERDGNSRRIVSILTLAVQYICLTMEARFLVPLHNTALIIFMYFLQFPKW
jgi:hypothetical protein